MTGVQTCALPICRSSADIIVKTRIWLYQVQQLDTIDPIYADKIGHIRYLLTVCLEEIDKLGAHDGKGWLC